MRKVLFALTCWATIGLASSRADVSYQYVADKTSFLGAAVGDTIPVSIFLRETVTGTSQSIIFRDKGMFGAGVKVNSPGGAIFGDNGNFQFIANTALSPAGFGVAGGLQDFNPKTANQSGLIVNADVTGTPNPGPNVPSAGAGVNNILLGTLNVKVLAAPTTLTVTPYGGGSNTITQAGTDLDMGTQAVDGYTGASAAPTFAFTVAVVPEPSSMALCGLVACGMSYAGFRRRKTAGSEPVTVG